MIFLVTLFLLGSQPVLTDSIFPPAEGPYAGDYVYITQPGRYTLEQDITHSYPVGVIIASPSVILDGQGYRISPSSSGSDPKIGIWITPYDKDGRPVTGITIRNLTVNGEIYGIYAEGTSSDFSLKTPFPSVPGVSSTNRSLVLSHIDSSKNRIGIVLREVSESVLDSLACNENTQSGIEISMGEGKITGSIISANAQNGILIRDSSGCIIRNNRIERNGVSGITLDQCSGLLISDNILDNNVDLIQAGGYGNLLNGEPVDATSIAGTSQSGEKPPVEENVPSPQGDMDQGREGGVDLSGGTASDLMDISPLLPGHVQEIPVETERKPAGEEIFSLAPSNPAAQVSVSPTPVPTPSTVITGSHAVIISDTIPTDMAAGETREVTMTLYNDGTDDWLPMHDVGIAALEEAASWGEPSYLVPLKSPLHSKESYSFTFEIRAPSSPGIYTLKYQAGRGFGSTGVEVTYGRPYTRTVTVR